MRIENNKIIYEEAICYRCDGSGKIKKYKDCPDKGRWYRKGCPHCGSKKKRDHNDIHIGFEECYICKGTGKVMEDKFNFIDLKVSQQIADNLIWKKAGEDWHDDGDEDTHLVRSCLSRIQYFGAEDYRDHRNDTLEQLKSKIIESIIRSHQALHYLKKDNTVVDTIYVKGYKGGYTGYFQY